VSKRIVIIAGPNGAGKTTFAREFLPNEAGCPIFVNADLIAAGLSPFAPELAAIKGWSTCGGFTTMPARPLPWLPKETTHEDPGFPTQ